MAQDRKRKIYFQDAGYGGHLGFLIGMILAMFSLQITPILRPKFKSLSDKEKKLNIDFKNGGCGSYLGFPIKTISVVFVYKLPLPSFGSIGLSSQEKKFKVHFSRLPPWQPSWNFVSLFGCTPAGRASGSLTAPA